MVELLEAIASPVIVPGVVSTETEPLVIEVEVFWFPLKSVTVTLTATAPSVSLEWTVYLAVQLVPLPAYVIDESLIEALPLVNVTLGVEIASFVVIVNVTSSLSFANVVVELLEAIASPEIVGSVVSTETEPLVIFVEVVWFPLKSVTVTLTATAPSVSLEWTVYLAVQLVPLPAYVIDESLIDALPLVNVTLGVEITSFVVIVNVTSSFAFANVLVELLEAIASPEIIGAVLSTNPNPPVFDTLKYVFAEEEKDKEPIILLLPIYNNLGEEILCVFTVDKVVSSSNSIVL